MRRILPLLLLFAVCFHTAWGWPAHMASHWPEHADIAGQGPLCQGSDHANASAQDEPHPEEATAHAACAWCAAHAQQSQALASASLHLPPAQRLTGLRPTSVAGDAAHPAQSWPFASRDPPAFDTL